MGDGWAASWAGVSLRVGPKGYIHGWIHVGAPASGVGHLSHETYAALKAPKSHFAAKTTARETEAALKKEEGGQELHRLLRTIQEGPSSAVPRVRNQIERMIDGGDVPDADRRKAERLLAAIHGSDVSGKKLYRGGQFKGSAEDVLAEYKPGSVHRISLGSFTSDRKVARKFSTGKVEAGARGGRGKTQVEFKWEEGTKRALPLQNITGNSNIALEKEYLASGQFEVISAKKIAGTVVITVRQREPA